MVNIFSSIIIRFIIVSIYNQIRDGMGKKYLYFPSAAKNHNLFYAFTAEIYTPQKDRDSLNTFDDSVITTLIKSFKLKE